MTDLSPEVLRDIKACVDRTPTPKTAKERMALVRGSMWNPGDAVRVSFTDGEPAVQQLVRDAAAEWMEHMSVRLLFNEDEDAEIRISFEDQGSWSYIGTDCQGIPLGQPTMNYGWLTPDSTDDEVRRVVLHEFGHALGCIHEHQNPDGGINWNKEVVYAYYAGPPNNWSNKDVDHNLFDLYDERLTVHTELDGSSIMMYPIDARFTTDGFSAELNTSLSDEDKRFMSECYP